MTSFTEASVVERARRLDLFYESQFGKDLRKRGCGPDLLVRGMLQTEDFDLTYDGNIVTASDRGLMIALTSREIQALPES